MSEVEPITCNLCGANDTRLFLRKQDLDIVCCQHCSLVYAHPRRLQKEIWKRYSKDYFWKEYMPAHGATHGEFVTELHRRRSSPVLERLKPFRQQGLVLEVGCAAGFFLKIAKDEGWEARGIEIMTAAVQYARDTLGLNVIEGTLEQANFANDMFDAVIMIETIEHLLDPAMVLREAYRIIRPGGAIWIATPNLNSVMASWLGIDWSVLSPSEHLYYFTETTLGKMLQAQEFRSVEFIWQLPGQHILETLNPFNNNKLNSPRGRLTKYGVLGLGKLIQPFVIRSKRTDRLIALAVK